MEENDYLETTPLIIRPLQDVNQSNGSNRSEYRVFKRRWFVLFVLALLNISNGATWISFSPIADKTMKFYSISIMDVNWLAMIYMISAIPLGCVAMWFLDAIGLRSSLILASWLNCTGGVLRVVSALPVCPAHIKYPLLLTGQGITSCAQPLLLFAPTKLAALWFHEDQRALANMVGSIANPVGIMLSNLISPAIVRSQRHLPLLMQVYLIPAGLGALLATFGVCSSRPPLPPSASASEVSEPFLEGLKKVVRIKPFYILMVSYGGGIAVVTVLITLLQQMLCPVGYNDWFVGLCGALMFGLGMVGAAIAAIYVDKTKKFEEVAKFCMAISTTLLMTFLVVARFHNLEVPIAMILAGLGLFGFALSPVCLELGVECTYPVAEATSSGLIIMFGQLLSIVLTVALPSMATPLSTHATSCSGDTPLDYTNSSYLFSAVGAFISIFFTIFFRCEYRRLRAEEQLMAERLLSAGPLGSRQPVHT